MKLDRYKNKTTRNVSVSGKFDDKNDIVLRRNNAEMDAGSNLIEVSNTQIDYHLSYNTTMLKCIKYICNYDYAFIDKAYRWNVLDYIRDRATIESYTTESFATGYDYHYIAFDLPIVETRLIKVNLDDEYNSNVDSKTRGWFKHGNKLYDPEKIYIAVGDDFKEWATVNTTPENSTLIPFTDNHLQQAERVKLFKQSGQLKEGKKDGNFTTYESFSSTPQLVTHLSFSGESPNVTIFPPSIQNKIYRTKRVKRVKRQHRSFIRVANNTSDLSYTTHADIHYLDSISKEWVNLGSIVLNTSPRENVIIDLSPFYNRPNGLLTSRFRIYPTKWVRFPFIKLVVFGEEAHTEKMVAQTSLSYALTIRKDKCWARDGLCRYRQFSEDYKAKFSRKRDNFRQRIIEGKDFYNDEMR